MSLRRRDSRSDWDGGEGDTVDGFPQEIPPPFHPSPFLPESVCTQVTTTYEVVQYFEVHVERSTSYYFYHSINPFHYFRDREDFLLLQQVGRSPAQFMAVVSVGKINPKNLLWELSSVFICSLMEAWLFFCCMLDYFLSTALRIRCSHSLHVCWLGYLPPLSPFSLHSWDEKRPT